MLSSRNCASTNRSEFVSQRGISLNFTCCFKAIFEIVRNRLSDYCEYEGYTPKQQRVRPQHTNNNAMIIRRRLRERGRARQIPLHVCFINHLKAYISLSIVLYCEHFWLDLACHLRLSRSLNSATTECRREYRCFSVIWRGNPPTLRQKNALILMARKAHDGVKRAGKVRDGVKGVITSCQNVSGVCNPKLTPLKQRLEINSHSSRNHGRMRNRIYTKRLSESQHAGASTLRGQQKPP